MHTKDDVARLVSDLGNVKLDPPVELGKPDCFGLALDLFDPVSGQVMTLARPARSDNGQSEIMLTAAQVGAAVVNARIARLHEVRTAGFASIADAEEAHKRNQAMRDLKAKQDAEALKLGQAHSDAAAKAAADAAPKKQVATAD
jgi:hypothetical protein